MKTIKDIVNEATKLTERLRAENPSILSISLEYNDLSVEEMEAAKNDLDTSLPEFRPEILRFTSCLSPSSGVFIHLRSVRVKAKLVYEPETV